MTGDPVAVKECETCHKPHPWPNGNTPMHPFNDGSLHGAATFGVQQKAEVKEMPWPFDPVLRQALISKGILTSDDLLEAEAQIRAVSGI